MYTLNWEFFQYCNSNIGLFSIAPNKVIDLPSLRFVALNLFASFFVSVLYVGSWLLFYIASDFVIAL